MIQLILTNYAWYNALIHFLTACLIFIIVNWLGAHSMSFGYFEITVFETEEKKTTPAFNLLFKVLSPIISYVIFVALAQSLGFQELVKYSFFIVVYYWLIRSALKIFLGRKKLTHWPLHFLYCVTSIGLSVWIYYLVIRVNKLLPCPRALLDQMWILIIIYLYNVLNKLEPSQKGNSKRIENYINDKYQKFKSKYGSIITDNCSNEYLEAVTYSIMIYEDFNRHIIARWIEYISFFLTKKNHTLGIMQVNTNKLINDEQSIILAIEKIKKAALKYKQKEQNNKETYIYAVHEIAGFYNCYNDGYQNAIQDVFMNIEKKYYNILENFNNLYRRDKKNKHKFKRVSHSNLSNK